MTITMAIHPTDHQADAFTQAIFTTTIANQLATTFKLLQGLLETRSRRFTDYPASLRQLSQLHGLTCKLQCFQWRDATRLGRANRLVFGLADRFLLRSFS